MHKLTVMYNSETQWRSYVKRWGFKWNKKHECSKDLTEILNLPLFVERNDFLRILTAPQIEHFRTYVCPFRGSLEAYIAL